MWKHQRTQNQHQFPYGATPPRVPIVAPNYDDFLPTSVPALDQILQI